jgi:hypothetical protein
LLWFCKRPPTKAINSKKVVFDMMDDPLLQI